MAKDGDMPGLEALLCFSIYSANHACRKLYGPLLKELGLSYPQYLVMVALWEADAQTVGQLGRRLFLDTNTLTPLLKRLESMALLTRRRDTADERVVRVALTETGQALRKKARAIPGCVLEALPFDAAEAQRLTAQLAALRDHLEAGGAP